MFVLDIDKASWVNTVHIEDCIHLITQNTSEKEQDKIGDAGGYLSFPNVGEVVRYLKTNCISVVIEHCHYCKPIKKFDMEPAAALGVEIIPTGCDSLSLDSPLMQKPKRTVEVTDTNTIAKRLVERLFGRR